MTRRLNMVLFALALLIGGPFYWLLIDNRPGDIAPKPLHMAELRRLAQSIPGQAPVSIEVEKVGMRHLPGDLFAAGSGVKRRQIAVMSFRLLVPGGKPIVIDSGITRSEAKRIGLTSFDQVRQTLVDTAMDQAGMILLTHEHPDHISGLLDEPGAPARLAKAWLNPAQIPAGRPAMPAPRIAASGLQALAPGMVVIPAPSHTPGSQMIFVRLASGREYLFAGDVATLRVSWEEVRARSRLVSQYLVPENREEEFAWLKTLRNLKHEAPQMVIVPGHDIERIIDDKHPSGILMHFGNRSPVNMALASAAQQR